MQFGNLQFGHSRGRQLLSVVKTTSSGWPWRMETTSTSIIQRWYQSRTDRELKQELQNLRDVEHTSLVFPQIYSSAQLLFQRRVDNPRHCKFSFEMQTIVNFNVIFNNTGYAKLCSMDQSSLNLLTAASQVHSKSGALLEKAIWSGCQSCHLHMQTDGLFKTTTIDLPWRKNHYGSACGVSEAMVVLFPARSLVPKLSDFLCLTLAWNPYCPLRKQRRYRRHQ